jgi:hypothetical protein
MKRNTRILLIAVAVAACLAVWLLWSNGSVSFRRELRDFAVADTASVTKIFLADRNNHSIVLRRDGEKWTVNGNEKARQEGVEQLLATIRSVTVQTRVAKAYYNVTVKDLASSGVKCEIYTNDTTKPAKVYYVGGPTQDNLGTNMMLQDSKTPFITGVPGFVGYLSSRYSVNYDDWRERVVFAANPATIRSISIYYPLSPDKSFRIEQNNGSYTVSTADGSKILSNPDTTAILNYMGFFSQLPFEDWDKELNAQQQDSLKASSPLAVIQIVTTNDSTQAILFRKAINRRSLSQLDEEGNSLKYDIDRMYASIKNGKELVIIQYFSFGKILRQLNDFMPKSARASKRK